MSTTPSLLEIRTRLLIIARGLAEAAGEMQSLADALVMSAGEHTKGDGA